MAVGIIIKIHAACDAFVGRLRAVASYKGGYIEQMERYSICILFTFILIHSKSKMRISNFYYIKKCWLP